MREKSIVELIEEMRPLLDANADALSIEDSKGQVIFVNEAYRIMTKRDRQNIVSEGKDIIINDLVLGKFYVHHDLSEINRLRQELNRINEKLRKIETKYTFEDIIGKNPVFLKMIKTAKSVALTPATIMLRGESGTGKEIFANAIHTASDRRYEKFVKINCSSVPEDLLESELFGYKEGAFTGALRGGKKGIFEEAHKGTLFLDEIGDISLRMQVKLLRVLQEREIMPVGGTEPIKIDVRIICATNKPLEDMIEEGLFREDLFYRLNVFPLFIPPLRERKEDIGPITSSLIRKYNEVYNRTVYNVDERAVASLQNREWRGNVRELENVVARVMIYMDGDAKVLTVEDIENVLHEESQKLGGSKKEYKGSLNDFLTKMEREYIEDAINRSGGDKNKAAYELGIPVRTLYYKCKKIGI